MNTVPAPHVVAIVQARMSSSRLPGKVLKEIAGRPMLDWVVERARRAQHVQQVVIATTDDPSDDAIEAYCTAQGYPCYRGSVFDVLDRFYQAARVFNAQVIVRLTADCPLIDPLEIDHTLATFFEQHADFAANRLPPPWKRTYPIGLDTEVCSFAALERAWHEATERHQREHVMPYLYEKEGRFKVAVVDYPLDYGSHRWTVDTPEDLELLQQIVAHFKGRDDFSWLEVIALFEREPQLAQINAGVHHKTLRDVDERMK